MKRKITLIILALFMSVGMIQAQNATIEKSYNRASIGLSLLQLKDTYYLDSDKTVYCFEDGKIWMKGIDINYLHGFKILSKLPLYVEAGGRITMDSYKDTYIDTEWQSLGTTVYETKNRLIILALSVPVNITYKYTFNNGLYIAPFAGIHMRLNLLGKIKSNERSSFGKEEDESYNIFKSGDDGYWEDGDEDDHAHRFQFGGQVGVNVGYKAWNLGIAYYLDTPLEEYKDVLYNKYDWKYKQGSLAITVGYNF